MSRTYLNFDLMIDRDGQGYEARVLQSPAGEASSPFSVPFSQLEVENFLLNVTRSVGDSRRRLRRIGGPEREHVEAFGRRLFESLFGGDVGEAYQDAVKEAERGAAGLRIRLRLTGVPELANLPWEFLFDPRARQFVTLSPDTPLVRYLELPLAARPLAVTAPLKVLVMIARPVGFPELDVEGEWERLQTSLVDLLSQGLVTLTRVERGTLGALQRPLRREEFHVLHFIGHGGFDEESQDGALVLESEDGNGRLVSGYDLGMMLLGHRSLRLVLLNACEGARSSVSDPFAGAAQALVKQGIPAVLAMQLEITDLAAIRFAQEFYGGLADGYPIDAALTESRRAIFADVNEVEWATPVLYMRSPSGRIFDVDPGSKAEPQRAEAQSEDSGTGTDISPSSRSEESPLRAPLVPAPAVRGPPPSLPTVSRLWRRRTTWLAMAVLIVAAVAIVVLTLGSQTPTHGPTTVGAYRATVLADRPVAFWPLDDAAQGGARDVAGPYDGVFQGGVRTGRGPFGVGPAADFDGADDWVQVGRLSLSGNFTIEAWVFLVGDVGKADSIVGQASSGDSLNFYDGHLRLYRGPRAGAPADAVVATTEARSATWIHWVVVRTGTALRVYRNGRPDGDGTLSDDFTLDAIGTANDRFFQGRMANVAVYNYALAPGRIRAHYRFATG